MKGTMKNTIYNAIQKQLVIDDGDSSISYKKADINNTFNIGLESLIYMYYYENKEDIFSTGSKNIVFISKNGKEYPFYSQVLPKNIIFLKISDPGFIGEDIIIRINEDFKNELLYHWVGNDIVPSSDKKVYIKNLKCIKDVFDGYQRTMERYNKIKNTKYQLPAIEYCISKKVNIKGEIYQGYLPSIEQLRLFKKLYGMITYIIEHFKLTYYKDIKNWRLNFYGCAWWSSTEMDEYNAWVINDHDIQFFHKMFSAGVWPFYKKIN